MRPTEEGQCRRAGKGGRRPPAWPPGGSPREAGGRAPQAGKPTPKRPQGARSGPAAKASTTRHAGRPARQVWGCGPSRPRSGPRRCVEGCAGGHAHRRATGTLPPGLPQSIAARANTIALRNRWGQARPLLFSVLGAKKRRSGSRTQLRRCPPACRRAARASRQMRRYAPCSACRRDSGLPRSMRETVRAETFRPASARVAAICSAS